MTIPATIADLVRLEDDIDEALLELMNKPNNELMIADLKRRQLRLKQEIQSLLLAMEGREKARPH